MYPMPNGSSRTIQINKPLRNNAFNPNMIKTLDKLIKKYDPVPVPHSILIKPSKSSQPFFSAGTDFLELFKQSNQSTPKNSTYNDIIKPWYSTVASILQTKKPILFYLNGHTFGSAAALSLHSNYRLVTENTRISFPEGDLGYIPDSGSIWQLARLDRNLGYYLALTGQMIEGVDLISSGIGTHFIDPEKFPYAEFSLSEYDVTEESQIAGLFNHCLDGDYSDSIDGDSKVLHYNLDLISSIFNPKSSLEQVFKQLESTHSTWSYTTLKQLNSKSPTSLASIQMLFTIASQTDYSEYLPLEYRVASRLLAMDDFKQGAETWLLRKQKVPQWSKTANVKALLEPFKTSAEEFKVVPLKKYDYQTISDVEFEEALYRLNSLTEVGDKPYDLESAAKSPYLHLVPSINQDDADIAERNREHTLGHPRQVGGFL